MSKSLTWSRCAPASGSQFPLRRENALNSRRLQRLLMPRPASGGAGSPCLRPAHSRRRRSRGVPAKHAAGIRKPRRASSPLPMPARSTAISLCRGCRRSARSAAPPCNPVEDRRQRRCGQQDVPQQDAVRWCQGLRADQMISRSTPWMPITVAVTTGRRAEGDHGDLRRSKNAEPAG